MRFASFKGLCSVGLVGLLCALMGTTLHAEEPQSPSATRIVINTSGPVAYHHLYRSGPPRIVFEFFHNTVYSSIQESVSIEKGVVKGIEATYFNTTPLPGIKKPLKTLTFHLLAETTYDVFEGPRSIVLVIRHPAEIPDAAMAKGKVLLASLSAKPFQSELRLEAMTDALQQAMGQASPQQERSWVQKPVPSAAPQISSPLSPAPEIPWRTSPLFFYGAAVFFILGGLLWPPSWFSLQNRMLRREKARSWEMAKRIISLKEESVAHETQVTQEAARHEEQIRSLQAELSLLREDHGKLRGELTALFEEKEKLKREMEQGAGDLHGLARERMELSDQLKAVQSELEERLGAQEDLLNQLREVSARCDQEIAHRRDLEVLLKQLQDERKISPKEAGEEKRRWTRLPLTSFGKRDPLTVEVQGPAGRLIYGYPKNLSIGGIAFELKENVELPNSLSFTLFFPAKKSGIEAQGKVVWKVQEGQKSYYGVSFTDLSQNANTIVRQFVKERLPQMREGARMIEESLKEKSKESVVIFRLEAPAAQSVSLAGDFNDWDPAKHPMNRTNDGSWKIAIPLPPGSYQYQFYVDGIWQADPEAKLRVSNPFGGENTVIEIS